MANPAGFSEAMRALVAQEVREALAPYEGLIASLQEFMGAAGGSVSRGATAPAAAPMRRARAASPTRRNAGGNSLELVGKFSQGQRVQYRQGKGTFDARVVEIDAKYGMLTVERESDGKRVTRPAAKVDAV
jgi:hypothetical protein